MDSEKKIEITIIFFIIVFVSFYLIFSIIAKFFDKKKHNDFDF